MIKTTNIYVLWRDHILLIKRSLYDSSNPLMWETPGGHTDRVCHNKNSLMCKQESLRELEEETGIVSSPKNLSLATQFSKTHSSYILVLKTKIPPKVHLSFEHSAFRWIDLRNPKAYLTLHLRSQVRDFMENHSRYLGAL